MVFSTLYKIFSLESVIFTSLIYTSNYSVKCGNKNCILCWLHSIFEEGIKQNIILCTVSSLCMLKVITCKGWRVFLAPFVMPIGWIRILYYWWGWWQKETTEPRQIFKRRSWNLRKSAFLVYSIEIFRIRYGTIPKINKLSGTICITSYPQNLTNAKKIHFSLLGLANVLLERTFQFRENFRWKQTFLK